MLKPNNFLQNLLLRELYIINMTMVAATFFPKVDLKKYSTDNSTNQKTRLDSLPLIYLFLSSIMSCQFTFFFFLRKLSVYLRLLPQLKYSLPQSHSLPLKRQDTITFFFKKKIYEKFKNYQNNKLFFHLL